MSLQNKFLLLLGVLTLAVASSVVAARWSFSVLHEQLRTPLESSASVMSALRIIKRNVEFQARIVQGRDPEEPVSADNLRWTSGDFRAPSKELMARFESISERTTQVAAAVRTAQWYRSRIGQRTWENILARIDDAESAAHQSFIAEAGDHQDALQAVAAFYEIHELIELTEGRILEDANASIASADGINVRLMAWLSAVTAVVLLTALLGVLLLRRWVQRPVHDLRLAAARLAAGDFDHRVPVRTSDEIGQLSAEVNHMASMVRSMQDERVQRERLAAVGTMLRRIIHNVRNPLAGIRGLAEVTRLDSNTDEQKENLDLIVSTVDTFERWLNELLDATSPVTLDPHTNSVEVMLQDIVAAHRAMAQVKNIQIELDCRQAPAESTFDPRHLGHAIAAVMANAVEASPVSSVVHVECTAQHDQWLVSVTDQGSGVSPEVRERIFQPHFTTKRTGTGIGLAMAQHVVRSHGGSITIESPESGGARFVIRIPFVIPEANMVENSQV